MIKVAVLTISDTRSKDTDASGKAIIDILTGDAFRICDYSLIEDDKAKIKDKLLLFTDHLKADLILTTGGTGLSSRDVTPEATRGISEREVPGISELIRIEGLKKTKNAMLSRGICVTRGRSLIINLPGSPKGAKESLSAVLDLIPHALAMLKGEGHG